MTNTGKRRPAAIVLAGDRMPPDHPLRRLTGVEKKALLPIAGRPMIDRVLEALAESDRLGFAVVAGLPAGEVARVDLPVHSAEVGAGNVIDSVLAGRDRALEIDSSLRQVLVCSSDLPWITGDTIRGFLDACGSGAADFYYPIVDQETMEAAFPGSGRTFVPLRGGRFCGGDLHLVRADLSTDLPLFRALAGARKSTLALARLFGLSFVVRFLLRAMTVEEATARVRARTSIDVRVVRSRHPELAMDVDGPRHFELAATAFEARHR